MGCYQSNHKIALLMQFMWTWINIKYSKTDLFETEHFRHNFKKIFDTLQEFYSNNTINLLIKKITA